MLVYRPPTTPEEKAKLCHSLKLFERFFELKMSEAMFAGSILQAAYTAILIFSRNETVAPDFSLFAQSPKAIRFCIGHAQLGVPIGLIVYAGRNQFCHWDEEGAQENTAAIFAALDRALENNPHADLAFDLGNPTINIYAAEILSWALRWTSYDSYLAEMRLLLTIGK